MECNSLSERSPYRPITKSQVEKAESSAFCPKAWQTAKDFPSALLRWMNCQKSSAIFRNPHPFSYVASKTSGKLPLESPLFCYALGLDSLLPALCHAAHEVSSGTYGAHCELHYRKKSTRSEKIRDRSSTRAAAHLQSDLHRVRTHSRVFDIVEGCDVP